MSNDELKGVARNNESDFFIQKEQSETVYSFDYVLRRISPIQGYMAVFAIQCHDDDKSCDLVAEEMDAVGIAILTTTKYVPSSNGKTRYAASSKKEWAQVSLVLMDGSFAICEDFDSFVGVIRKSESTVTYLKHVTGFKGRTVRNRLVVT